MRKEKVRDYLRCADALLDKLPGGAKIIDISLSGDGYILLHGNFDFRRLAEAEGAQVRVGSFVAGDGTKYADLTARLFGCEVSHTLKPGSSRYEEELRRCEGQ